VRDFCNTPKLFLDEHIETRIFCLDVSNFLQAGGVGMKSAIVKRSVVVAGHKTSVSLEDAFWNCLKEIAGNRQTNLSDLVAVIDSQRQYGNLSSAIRLFVQRIDRRHAPLWRIPRRKQRRICCWHGNRRHHFIQLFEAGNSVVESLANDNGRQVQAAAFDAAISRVARTSRRDGQQQPCWRTSHNRDSHHRA
jgi:predicted DNA-binding ribbon-helix-helix protein